MFGTARHLLFGGVAGKCLGVVRELMTAALFGTGPVAVAYRLAQAAFLIPLHGFLSEAFTAGFTPAYARLRAANDDAADALFAVMQLITLSISVIVGLLLAWLAGAWVGLLAPGLAPDTAATATDMVTLLALAVPFYALASLYAAAEIASGGARMAAARASVQNIGLIAGCLGAWAFAKPVLIAAGFLGAYSALAVWGFCTAGGRGSGPWPLRGQLTLARNALAGVWRAIRLLLLVPVLLQVHLIVERRVASFVSESAVAAVDYARFLSDTTVLLLAVPLGLAGLGAMSQLDATSARDLAHRSLRMLLYVGLPLSLVMALHGEAIVTLIFARGAFGPESIASTATILEWLALGLWARLLGYAGAKYLSAGNRNLAVIGIHAAAVGCNVAVNVLLYPRLGAAALGIGAAVHGLVFGLLVLSTLGLLGRLLPDLATLALVGAAYATIWRFAPDAIAAGGALTLAVFVAYWSAASALIPRCRQVVVETWLTFRAA